MYQIKFKDENIENGSIDSGEIERLTVDWFKRKFNKDDSKSGDTNPDKSQTYAQKAITLVHTDMYDNTFDDDVIKLYKPKKGKVTNLHNEFMGKGEGGLFRDNVYKNIALYYAFKSDIKTYRCIHDINLNTKDHFIELQYTDYNFVRMIESYETYSGLSDYCTHYSWMDGFKKNKMIILTSDLMEEKICDFDNM